MTSLPTAEIASKKKVTRSKLPYWRLGLPLFLQTLLILAVPTQKLYIYNTGTTITLQTAPVDPYDLMRGYSQNLNYEISNPQRLQQLLGGEILNQYNTKFYVVLEAPADNTHQAWQPIRISRDLPQHLAANQVVLKGQAQGGRIVYGLETYYIPEEQRNQINQTMHNMVRDKQVFVVDIKVDKSGNAVPVSLWLGEHKYQF